MANVYATKNGNWSDTTLWNTLALPTVNDDVWSNNFTVYVDGNFQVLSIRNKATTGITTGGRFILNDGVSLSANVEGSGATGVANSCLQFLSAAPASATLYGNLSSNNTALAVPGVLYHNGTGTLTIYGDLLGGINNGGNANSSIITNNRTGTLTMFGSITAGTGNSLGFYGIGNLSVGTVNIIGNVTGGYGTNTQTNCQGIRNTSTGSIFVTGDCFAGQKPQSEAILNGAGQLAIIGNLFAGPRDFCYGISNSTGTVYVVGNAAGGTGNSSHGINNSSFGTVFVTGNLTGGTATNVYGINNSAAGRVIINGNVIAGTGTTTYGAVNNATGYMEVNGIAVGNGWGLGSSGIGGAAPGILGSQTGTTIIRGLSCGARGQWPTAGNVFIIPQSTSTATFETSAFQDVTLITSLSDGIVPPVSSVRQGTVYNLGDYRGTCAMPSVSAVLEGISVDNSVGIAALQPQTIWNYSTLSATDVNSLGGRLKEVATVQSVGQQLTALN